MKTNAPDCGPFFDRETAGLLKGAALILMFFHHFFTFPAWIVADAGYPLISAAAPFLSRSTRICAPAFAFLTGCAACWQPKRGTREGILRDLRRATDFLLSYWMVYAVLLLFARFTGRAVLDPREILPELFGLTHKIVVFNWYVPFYLLSLPCLRLLSRPMDRGPVRGIVWGIVLPSAVFAVLAILFRGGEGTLPKALAEVFENARDCFPAAASGYLAARYDWFRRILEKGLTDRFRSPAAKTALCVSLAVFACAGRYLLPAVEIRTGELFGKAWNVRITMDAVWALLFVWSLARLLRPVCGSLPGRLLGVCGRLSMLLWFWHCVFFNVCRDLTQPVLYAPRLWPLVLLWGLALCFAAARLTEIPLRRILGLKNRLLFRESSG